MLNYTNSLRTIGNKLWISKYRYTSWSLNNSNRSKIKIPVTYRVFELSKNCVYVPTYRLPIRHVEEQGLRHTFDSSEIRHQKFNLSTFELTRFHCDWNENELWSTLRSWTQWPITYVVVHHKKGISNVYIDLWRNNIEGAFWLLDYSWALVCGVVG